MKQEKKNWDSWREKKNLGMQFTKKILRQEKDMLAVSII